MSKFVTTQWSLVYAARVTDERTAKAALSELCQRYRGAVLAYARRLVQDQNEAEDLTQGFFIKLLEQRIDTVADPARGRFRNFLCVAAGNYFRSHFEAQRALKRLMPDEVPEPQSEQSPEQAFDSAWVKVVVSTALTKLRVEAEQSDKLGLFEAIRPFLIDEVKRDEYVEIAAQQDMRANTFAVSVHRMKTRLRDLVRAELSDTVTNKAELEEELRALRPSRT